MAEQDNAQRAGQLLTDLFRRPGESIGSYLLRAQAMTKPPYQRQVPDNRSDLAKLTGDMTTGISDNELEDWYMTLDEKTIPEHEQFKDNVARVLEEPVFIGTPIEEMPYGDDYVSTGANGYVPMTFDQFFGNQLLPQLLADEISPSEMKEQIVARLTGEPHNFQDENVKQYTTMVLDNLKAGQSADNFPAMTQEEADEAYAKYGTKARFYIGRENRDNFARRKAYELLQTFADGEHAPPLQGIATAALGFAGQQYTNIADLLAPQPRLGSNDGGDGYENVRVAMDALGGPLGRIRQANKFYERATNDPEFVRDPVTGANYADESNLSITGMGNSGAKSDGYYQYLTNRLLNLYDNTKFQGPLDPLLGLKTGSNQIQPPEVMDELARYEQQMNRTTPIVPGRRYVSPTDDIDNSPAEEAADLFKSYKEYTAGAFDRGFREQTGMNPTQFQSSMGNLFRNTVTDPGTLAGTAISAGIGGLLGGTKGMATAAAVDFGRELMEEGGYTGALESLLTGPAYFTEPLEGAGYGPYDSQEKALKAIELTRKQGSNTAKEAARLMRQQRSPIGESLLLQEEPPKPRRRPYMIQMPPKPNPDNVY